MWKNDNWRGWREYNGSAIRNGYLGGIDRNAATGASSTFYNYRVGEITAELISNAAADHVERSAARKSDYDPSN
jgi:hypothetical protein